MKKSGAVVMPASTMQARREEVEWAARKQGQVDGDDEDGGTFQVASADVLKGRRIRKVKRKREK